MPDKFFNYFDSDRPSVDPEATEWQILKYKSYPRAEKIILPKPEKLHGELETALLKRKSSRNFSGEAISLQSLSNFLFWSVGLIHKNEPAINWRRPHPSGGTLFPIEIYLSIFYGQDIEAGLYHYNTENHILESLKKGENEAVRSSLIYDFAREASMLVILTFSGTRVFEKYGSLGYKLGMLEAGHIAQNLYLVGGAIGWGVLSLGGVDYEVLEKELDLAPREETALYLLAVGPVAGHAYSPRGVDNGALL